MKMKPEHFALMKDAMQKHDTDMARDRYVAAGLSTDRYRWDLLRHVGLQPWLCDTLYTYLDDSHVQTALNKIIKPL